MRNVDKWEEYILGTDKKFTLEEKIFNAIVFSSSIVGILLFIGDLVNKLGPDSYLFSLSGSIVMILIYIIARRNPERRF